MTTDRIEELAAELARVTAERDKFVECVNKSESVAERGNLVGEVQQLRAIFPEILKALQSGSCAPDCSIEFLREIPREVQLVTTALRARVAELEVAADHYEQDAKNEAARAVQAEQRVAELEASLRDLLGEYADHGDALAKIARAEQSLARAKPAAPAKDCASPRFQCAGMSRTPIADYLRDYAHAIDIGESQEAAQHAQWLRKAADALESTPEQHPDSAIIDWLFRNGHLAEFADRGEIIQAMQTEGEK